MGDTLDGRVVDNQPVAGQSGGKQSVRQAARRAALDAQTQLRQRRADRESRLSALGVAVTVALSERDVHVAAFERSAAEALRTMTQQEGLSLREAVTWCGTTLTPREAARLRGLADAGRDETEAASERTPPLDVAVVNDASAPASGKG